MLDCFRRELIVGDVVVWATKYGDRLYLRAGTLTRVEPKYVVATPRKMEDEPSWWTKRPRKAVLSRPRSITYIGRDDDA